MSTTKEGTGCCTAVHLHVICSLYDSLALLVDRSTMKLCLAASLIVLATAASPAVAFTAGSSFVGGAKQVGSVRGGASRTC
jgi:hypothetical protein